MNRPENNPSAGSKCGPYTLVRRIGEGGMGEVFEAIQTSLKRRVALKLLAKWACKSKDHRDRFLKEGEIAARMRHPNIVEVHDVGTWGERPYLVMELLEGRPLDVLLAAEQTVNEARLAELMLPILSAVAAAHDRGVVHRDLKPENIFIAELDSGMTPKVLDFGISQVMSDQKQDEYIYGTPHYMSPEQVQGSNGDARSDQYALGIVLHEMTTGQTPFDDPTLTGLLDRVSEGPYPAHQLDGASEGLRSLILRATQRDPSARFADVRDMALALASCATPSLRKYWKRNLGGPVTVPPRAASALPTQQAMPLLVPNAPPDRIPNKTPKSRAPGVFAALAVAGALVVAGGAWMARSSDPSQRVAPAVANSLDTVASLPDPSSTESVRSEDELELGVELENLPESDSPVAVDPSELAGELADEEIDEGLLAPPARPIRSPRMGHATGTTRGSMTRGSMMTETHSPWGSAPAAPISMQGHTTDPWAH